MTEYEAGAVEACSSGERMDKQEELLDTLMLGLRLAEGLDVRQLCARFGLAAARETLHALAAQPTSRVAAFASEAEGGRWSCMATIGRVWSA